MPTIATDDSDYEGRELEPENNHEGKESEDIKKTKKLDGGKKKKKGKKMLHTYCKARMIVELIAN